MKRAVDGVLLIDKPSGFTSNQLLQKCRRLLQAAKGGHTGTLDPLATGLLPLCFGEATKFAQRLLDADKRYLAHIQLGATTTTGDIEGEILQTWPVETSLAQIQSTAAQFIGKQAQTPPMYSALKHQGKPLYEYARAGQIIERPSRSITIYAIEVQSYQNQVLVVDVHCSKGTYIRTLAENIGSALGCGGHLLALRRTATAGFVLDSALTLNQFENMDLAARDIALLPVDSLISDFPALQLDRQQTQQIMNGQVIQEMAIRPEVVHFSEKNARIVAVRLYGRQKDGHSTFIGMGELADSVLRSRRLLSTIKHHQ